MANPSVSTSTQAVAGYASQLQAAQAGSRPRGVQPQGQSAVAQRGDRVTLSTQSLQVAGGVQAERGAQRSAAAQVPSNTNSPAATIASESKSVTQALQAYVQASLV